MSAALTSPTDVSPEEFRAYITDAECWRALRGRSSCIVSVPPGERWHLSEVPHYRKHVPGSQIQNLPVGSVVRWSDDQSPDGYRMHIPQIGWMPMISMSSNYDIVFVPRPDSEENSDS